jgi:hypothetical protein
VSLQATNQMKRKNGTTKHTKHTKKSIQNEENATWRSRTCMCIFFVKFVCFVIGNGTTKHTKKINSKRREHDLAILNLHLSFFV